MVRAGGWVGGTSDYVGIVLQNWAGIVLQNWAGIMLQNWVGIMLQNWAGKLYTNRGSHTHAWLQLDFCIQITVAY